MANNYYERGDRLNILLADELPEDMTGKQDTQHICGKCAWYSFAKLESICRKTGKEVAYFANRECFTTDKDMDMEENNNAQPVAESTGTQVCKECGRRLPLEDFQRRRNGNVDNVCKACRAEKARIGIARKKAVKVELSEKIAKAVSAPSPASEAALEEAVKTEGEEIAQLCRYLVEFKMAGLALWGMMPGKEEDIDQIIEAKWIISCCHEIFAAAAELKLAGAKVVPALVAKRIYWAEKFIEDLGNAFYPLAKECDTDDVVHKCAEWSEKDEKMLTELLLTIEPSDNYDEMRNWLLLKLKSLLLQGSKDSLQTHWKPSDEPAVVQKCADFSDAALLDELRRRGYKGRISKCEEVEI